ncbi:MAG: hypothetical protein H0T42_26815 [Deltaproteobacteria bacterium]|nr:hypothetical protein [Deltaproteobacteria bacterium]
MAPDDPPPDPKVKELLERDLGKPLKDIVGEVTAAELERWFGLPTFQQVEEGEVKLAQEDPDMVAVRERRAKAIEAVDPGLLEAHRRRTDGPVDDLLKFKATITLRVKEDVSVIDIAMIERKLLIAEARELQRPEDIDEQLEDNTPQALLRDLHRPELSFEKTFELVDMAAEQKIDVVAEVNAAMATSWKLPALGIRPGIEARQLTDEIKAELRSPWPAIPDRVNLPNRRVQK